MPGVIAVLWGGNTPPFGGKAFELSLFNRNEVTYRGQLIGTVIADTLENARAAAAAVRVDYTQAEHLAGTGARADVTYITPAKLLAPA
jgi:xanthine dehydrogenase YagR molybdenum-binding subunit